MGRTASLLRKAWCEEYFCFLQPSCLCNDFLPSALFTEVSLALFTRHGPAPPVLLPAGSSGPGHFLPCVLAAEEPPSSCVYPTGPGSPEAEPDTEKREKALCGRAPLGPFTCLE